MNNFPKFCGCSSNIGLATSIQSSKLKWAWQAQLLSHIHKTLQNCFFLKDLQMILVPFFEIFDRFWSTKKLASLHLHVNQDLLGLLNSFPFSFSYTFEVQSTKRSQLSPQNAISQRYRPWRPRKRDLTPTRLKGFSP